MLTALKKTMQQFYDSVGARYAHRDEGLKQVFHNASELLWLEEINLEGKKILDVGTGTGRLLRYLEQRRQPAALCCAVDLSMEMLRTARIRGGGWLIQCDAEALPFAGNAFDLLVCLGLLEYVADLRPYLREFLRVLPPRGLLLFTCRNADGWSSFPAGDYPVAYHSAVSVCRVLQDCGFSLLRHTTAYHLQGRWIWGLTRAATRSGFDQPILRLVIAANRWLGEFSWTRYHGKTHLFLVRRR